MRKRECGRGSYLDLCNLYIINIITINSSSIKESRYILVGVVRAKCVRRRVLSHVFTPNPLPVFLGYFRLTPTRARKGRRWLACRKEGQDSVFQIRYEEGIITYWVLIKYFVFLQEFSIFCDLFFVSTGLLLVVKKKWSAEKSGCTLRSFFKTL